MPEPVRSKRSESSCPHTNGKTTPKKGKICQGSHKEWVPEANEACGSLPALLFQYSDSLLDSRPGRGRRRLRRGGRCCTLPGCVRKGRAGRKAHPLPRRGHTWPLQAGRGARPAPGSSESGLPPRTAPWGPPDGPAARPAKQAGNGRLGCLERSRLQQGRGPD